MEDITGLGKLAESKLANKVYDDGLSGGVQEAGKIITDVAKTFRLFTLPFQYAAAAQDRIAKHVEKVRNAVPPQRQIEAAPSIAGPVLQALVFLEDNNPLLQLFLNLLTRAIDKDRVSEAHPAFANIISQLSSDEARVLWVLHAKGHRVIDFPPHESQLTDFHFPLRVLDYPKLFYVYHSHLAALNLVTTTDDATYFIDKPHLPGPPLPGGYRYNLNDLKDILSLTHFGGLFAAACIPPDTEILEHSREQALLPPPHTKPTTIHVARYT